jgi:hypothetical protein
MVYKRMPSSIERHKINIWIKIFRAKSKNNWKLKINGKIIIILISTYLKQLIIST